MLLFLLTTSLIVFDGFDSNDYNDITNNIFDRFDSNDYNNITNNVFDRFDSND